MDPRPPPPQYEKCAPGGDVQAHRMPVGAALEPDYVLRFDGASRGNPGPSSAAFVISKSAGGGALFLDRAAEFVGPSCTNNVAEYTGLIRGLEALLSHGIDGKGVQVEGDSKLVLEQVQGRWKVNQPHLKTLCGRAQMLAKALGVTRWKWIPRSHNHAADHMCNEVLDCGGRASPQSSSSLSSSVMVPLRKRKWKNE